MLPSPRTHYTNLTAKILHCLATPTSPLAHASQAHANILKLGITNDTDPVNKLISLYATNLNFNNATQLLNTSLTQPDIKSFSSVIYALSKSRLFDRVLRVFKLMLERGVLPDAFVLPSVVKACGGLLDLRVGQRVHGVACVCGFGEDLFVQGSLLHMYVRFGRVGDARKVFDRMSERDVVVWSALVAGYARNGVVGEVERLVSEMERLGVEMNLIFWNGVVAGFKCSGLFSEAIGMFCRMHEKGFRFDETSVSSVLPAVGDLQGLNFGVLVHGCVFKLGLGSDVCVVSALIDMYGKCGSTVEMLRVFDEMKEIDIGACNAIVMGLSRNGLVEDALKAFKGYKAKGMELDVVSWTSMVASCSQNGKDIEALELFRDMQVAGVKPNSVTIPCMLPACGNISALTHGKAAHCFSIRRGMSNDVYVASALVDMYANCGKIQASRLCFDKIPRKNLVCWNAIMNGYAMHGNAKEAIKIFKSMVGSGQKPDSVSFTCVLSACTQSGLADEGWHYFISMSKNHGIEPRLEHYACMVNLLGRAGRFEDALSMIKQMPIKPDACVWGSLLSACRVHSNVDLAEISAKNLFQLEPKNPGNYILLSNIYANKGLRKKVNSLRDMMKNSGLRKNPGCSWIEVKNKVYTVLAGDKSLPQIDKILVKLQTLSMEMKKLGYAPDIDFVLQDVEEQDKEQILCEHSEKLAVVFGLLNTKPGTPLRVIKNLRICGDCHTVIKFISSFEEREIFVRDTNRFHHFINGVCSCGDYW